MRQVLKLWEGAQRAEKECVELIKDVMAAFMAAQVGASLRITLHDTTYTCTYTSTRCFMISYMMHFPA